MKFYNIKANAVTPKLINILCTMPIVNLWCLIGFYGMHEFYSTCLSLVSYECANK